MSHLEPYCGQQVTICYNRPNVLPSSYQQRNLSCSFVGSLIVSDPWTHEDN